MKNILFVGVGKMGSAILFALTKNNQANNNIFFYETNESQANEIVSSAQRVASLKEGFSKADIIFLCIKPQVFKEHQSSFKTEFEQNKKGNAIIVSIMAGVSVSDLSLVFSNAVVIRTMPNIAVTVKKGTIAIVTNNVPENILQIVESLFSACATCVRVLENQIDAVTGLSGSGPAFVFQFIEALIMSGVKVGLSREIATKLAISTIIGASEMVDKLNISPSNLTTDVCSPGGTTIAGIQVLENKAFKGTVMAAVEAAAKRSAELGK